MPDDTETHTRASELADLRQRVAELEQMLADSQVEADDLTHFFRLSLPLFCIVGFDGYFKRLNPAWEQMLGYTTQELHAQRWIDLVYPDEQMVALAALEQAQHEETIVDFVNRYRTHDGSYAWVAWQVTALPRRQRFYAVGHNVTEYRQLQESLRTSIRHYRVLARNVLHDGSVLLFDHNLRYLIAEGSGVTVIGFSREELEDKTLWEVFPTDVCSVLEPHYRAALNDIRREFEIEYHEHTYQVSTLPVPDQDGTVLAGMAFAWDITEQKMSQKQMVQLNSELQQLLEDQKRQVEASNSELAALLRLMNRFEE